MYTIRRNLTPVYLKEGARHALVRIRADDAAGPGLEMIFSDPHVVSDIGESGIQVAQEHFGKDVMFVRPDAVYAVSVYSTSQEVPPAFDSLAWEAAALTPDAPIPTKDYPSPWPAALRYPAKFAVLEARLEQLSQGQLARELAEMDLQELAEVVKTLFPEVAGDLSSEKVANQYAWLIARSGTWRTWYARLLFKGPVPQALSGLEKFFFWDGWKVTGRSGVPGEDERSWLGIAGKDGWAGAEIFAVSAPDLEGYSVVEVTVTTALFSNA